MGPRQLTTPEWSDGIRTCWGGSNRNDWIRVHGFTTVQQCLSELSWRVCIGTTWPCILSSGRKVVLRDRRPRLKSFVDTSADSTMTLKIWERSRTTIRKLGGWSNVNFSNKSNSQENWSLALVGKTEVQKLYSWHGNKNLESPAGCIYATCAGSG